MATKVQAPQLTPNNRIYLYQLLSRELGCGKQTFMPAVEEALARDRMTSDDLGFESTRALLEALEEFVKLTVFKGGRIYATVMAQPAWDEALAALETGKAKDAGGPSNKPWKRKKADKALKPVRPKRVKRPEPAPEPEPIAKTEAVESPALPAAAAQTRAEETEATSENTNADAVNIPEDAPATETAEAVEAVETVEVVETTGIHEKASLTEPDDACACVEGGPQPSPAVSLTVTYDPYSGIDRETKLESHPISPKPDQAPLEPTCAPSQLATNPTSLSVAPASLSPAVLATYPTDFSTEVYLASELIADLCELLPYGTDVFTLLAEDYARARTLELISGTRARATFPLRIQHADSIEPIRVTLKKRGGTGLQWELSAVE
ncbi:hypothetical protein COLINT_02676 [Collinsella intestinalis DSM 13280]|uniref:Uncharacterized protein n=1 Tax=Collinsella intestinalis DSM 13280 TaxID=521003 RepID=C4F9E2_9ACTN|nr:hypothetical protein [Collinsella intestinalis]EEP44630.1 hypothetical protein COLINT_02676 [Collinsella intestinalis DSM 13280]